jgi:DNA polymerase V
MIALVDCQNFFVSCERVFRPDLENRPVLVVSNNDGCIIARSNEVKRLGIPMGAPLFKYKQVVRDHNIKIFSSNFRLYGDFSKRIMSILGQYTPKMEIYSVDEAFLDIEHIKNFQEFGRDLRQKIHKETGIPVGIGVAPSKVLSKVANKIAKSRGGLCVLDNLEYTDECLKKCDVGDVWGVGRKTCVKLKQMGVHTAYELKCLDPRVARKKFTIMGERLVRELNGLPCLQIQDVVDVNKSIQVTRSFGKKIYEYDELREAVATYAFRLSEKLRCQSLAVKTLGLYIRNSPYTDEYQKYENFIHFDPPIYATNQLIEAAGAMLLQIYKPKVGYIKAGLIALGLEPICHTAQQPEIFESVKPDKKPFTLDLDSALDHLNYKYGKEFIKTASCGINREWLMKCALRSPAYTYKWEEVPIVG